MHVLIACAALRREPVQLEIVDAAGVEDLCCAAAVALSDDTCMVAAAAMKMTVEGRALSTDDGRGSTVDGKEEEGPVGGGLFNLGVADGVVVEVAIPPSAVAWGTLHARGMDIGAWTNIDYRAVGKHFAGAFDSDPPAWETLQLLLEAAQQCTPQGQRILPKLLSQHTARCLVHVETARALFAVPRFPVNRMYQGGMTALMLACADGLIDTADALLAARADITLVTPRERWTALMWAASNGHTDVVARLCAAASALGCGAGVVNAVAGSESAVTIAADRGHVGAVTALLDAGAGAEVPSADCLGDGCAWSGVLAGAAAGRLNIVHIFLSRGAPAHTPHAATRWSPLHHAAYHNHVHIAAALLAHDTPHVIAAAAASDAAPSALALAAARGHHDIMQLLLAHGAALNTPGGPFAQTPLLAAVFHRQARSALLLLERSAAAAAADLVAARDACGRTALVWAAVRGDRAVVAAILACGGDHEAMDVAGAVAVAADEETRKLLWT